MRKAVICIAAVAIVIMLLCPPWRMAYWSESPGPHGYHWIWSPPETIPADHSGPSSMRDPDAEPNVPVVDFERLGLQVAAVAVVAATIVTLMPRGQK